MEVTPAIAELIRHRAAAPKLRVQAMVEGTRTLKQDGILKVIAGATTMAQVRAAAAA